MLRQERSVLLSRHAMIEDSLKYVHEINYESVLKSILINIGYQSEFLDEIESPRMRCTEISCRSSPQEFLTDSICFIDLIISTDHSM